MADQMHEMLSNLDDTYKGLPDSLEVPEGVYIAMIKDATFCKANSSNRLHIKIEMQILKGKFLGFNLWSYDLHCTDREGNADAKGMVFLKQALMAMGVQPPSSMTQIGEAAMQLNDRVVQIEVKKNGDFTNIAFQRLIHENHTKWVTEGEPDTRVTGDRKGAW